MTNLSRRDEIRELAENDLEVFIKLIHPGRILGAVHRDLIHWWAAKDLEGRDHQLVLLPRDHMKSALIGYRCAWEITRNPAVRILYISATSNLAEKQLYFVKQILDNDIYKRYWPQMLDPEEGRREKWTAGEISVDHPKRKAEAVRDPTIFTAGLTTVITGMHCDIAVLDDVVIKENAYSLEGRGKVASQYSLLSSIEGADAREWIVGTRYHPKDLYGELESTQVDTFDENGEVNGSYKLYETFERRVENIGDGSGEYLWPRQQRSDGKWFGFDQSILAKKRAKYQDKTQFRAQYYNDPNDPESSTIKRDLFQYYDQKYITQNSGYWYFKARKLNVYASIDFAYSLSKKSDFTAITVVGVDHQSNYYVLDIDRFKTDKIVEVFAAIQRLFTKWGFRKLRAECTAAQSMIVGALKEHIKQNGLTLSIDEHRPNKYQGNKDERIKAILEPRYSNQQIWHYSGGYCQILEEELIHQNPSHDDVKDALAACIAFCVPPSQTSSNVHVLDFYKKHANSRFGGIS